MIGARFLFKDLSAMFETGFLMRLDFHPVIGLTSITVTFPNLLGTVFRQWKMFARRARAGCHVTRNLRVGRMKMMASVHSLDE